MSLLLIAYIVFLFGYATVAASALYHAYKFGYPGDKTRLAASIYISVITLTLIGSFILIGTTDWGAQLP